VDRPKGLFGVAEECCPRIVFFSTAAGVFSAFFAFTITASGKTATELCSLFPPHNRKLPRRRRTKTE